jgi:hypothetical protein
MQPKISSAGIEVVFVNDNKVWGNGKVTGKFVGRDYKKVKVKR